MAAGMTDVAVKGYNVAGGVEGSYAVFLASM